MTLTTRKAKAASCWKTPAARTSRSWRSNALFPDHFRPVRGGGYGHPRQARRPFPQAAALYLPRYGMAAQTAPTEGERLFHQWPEFATAGGRHDCAQRSDSDNGWSGVSVSGRAGEHWPHHGHDQLRGEQSLADYGGIAQTRATAVYD